MRAFRPGLQHGDELCDEHQLASLWRRIDLDLLDADARAHRPKLCLRGDRDGRPHALIRGLARRTATTIGNFWVDLTRGTLYILFPLSLLFSLFLVSQGIVQTLHSYQTAVLLEPLKYDKPVTDSDGHPVLDEKGQAKTEPAITVEQVLGVGPAASQIAIKQLGTNGGGFFNVNSAHPFENATPLSNFFEVLAILLIPAALCYTFGMIVGDTRQGWALLAAMPIILVCLVPLGLWSEQTGNPRLDQHGHQSECGFRTSRREYGGQRDPLRHHELGSLVCRHDCRFEWVASIRCTIRTPRSEGSSRFSSCNSEKWCLVGSGPASTA